MNNRSRTKNSIINVSYGFAVTTINALLSFINRTALVKILGKEALGINGLFTEIISVMSLAELGVGMAIIYSLYKPINDHDENKIDQLMWLYRKAYNWIALLTFIIGLAVTPFIHLLITDVSYPISFIRAVFFLFVVQTSTSYLYSYKASLLNADQKQYITSLYTCAFKAVFTVLSVIILITTENYILYLIVLVFQSIITNFAIGKYVDREYSFLTYKNKLSQDEQKKIFGNIKNIFIKRVSGVITSSTDNILISTLVSTIKVGLYSNYIILFNLARTFRRQLTNGIAASIGNLTVTEDSEKCINVLRRLTFIYFVMALIISEGLMSVASPFISVWLGEEYILDRLTVYIAIYNLFLEITLDPLWQYLEVSGLFKQDKNIGILGSSVNLVVSIILGFKIGMAGIFIGTILTQVIQGALKAILLFEKKFNKSPIAYFTLWFKYSICYLLCIISQFGVNRIYFSNDIVTILLKASVSVLLSILLIVFFYLNTDEYKYCIGLINKVIRRKK